MNQNSTESVIKEFERTVLKFIIFDDDFCSRAISKIDHLYFEDEYYQYIFKKVKEFNTKNQQNKINIPSSDVLKTEMKQDKNVLKYFKNDLDFLFKHINEIYSSDIAKEPKEWIVEKTQAWIKKKGIVINLFDMFETIQKETDPLKKSNAVDPLIPKLEEAVKVDLTPQKIVKVSDFNNIKNMIHKLSQGLDLIQSNINIINRAIGENLKRGAVNLCIGGTGSGKSIHLLGHFLSPLERGYNCLYASFELDSETIVERYASNIYNIPKSKLRSFAMEDDLGFINELDKKHVNMNHVNRGEGYIINYPAKSAGVSEVNNYIKYIERTENIKIDCVIFDYVQNMKLGDHLSEGRNQPEWSKLDGIIKEMEAFAISNNVMVWSAMQLKPDAKEKETLTDVDISASKQVLNSCSGAYAFLYDKKIGHHKCFLLKSRHGNMHDYQTFLLGIDFQYQRIRDIDQSILSLTEDDHKIINSIKEPKKGSTESLKKNIPFNNKPFTMKL